MDPMTGWTRRLLATALAALLTLTTAFSQAEETITYIHWDAQGSPVAATDEDGNVVWRESYQPYGERINNESAAGPHSRWYTGHPQDEDTGLIYAGARYYDPVIGRFLGPDPVEFQEGNLHSFNRYAYGNNSPYVYVDPDGRIPILLPVVVFLAKEAAAEVASRVTGGATDFLSVRRTGTKAAKGLGRLFTDSGANAEKVTRGGAGPVRIGQAGEKMAGVTGPKIRIPSATGTAKFRVPDKLTVKQLREVKNVQRLRTGGRAGHQLEDFSEFARQTGRGCVVCVRQGTRISPRSQQFLDDLGITVERGLP